MLTRRALFGAAALTGPCNGRLARVITGYVNGGWAPSVGLYAYEVGNFRVTMTRPRVAAVATAGQYAHFPGLNFFPTGEILLHYPTIPDTDVIDGISTYVVSTDGGMTFPTANSYQVDGNHTSGEPLVMGVDGILRGGTFDPRQMTHPGGDLRKLQMPLQTVSNGGRTTVLMANGVTISGFPSDIGEFSPGVIGCSWFGHIVKITESRWVSTILPKFVGETQIFCQCIETTDTGVTWNVVGQVAGAWWDEGLSEATMIRLTSGAHSGRLIVYSRSGVTPIARAYSDDIGRTWTLENNHVSGVNAWCKAPFSGTLASGDFAITCGYMQAKNSEPIVHTLAPAQVGLYLSDDPMANNWPVVDLIAHHNRTYPELAYDDVTNQCTGYTSWVEYSAGNLLICYDQDYSTNGRPNRVFVVNAKVERIT